MIRSPYISHCKTCRRTVELMCETLKTMKKYYCKVCKKLVRQTNTTKDGEDV